jgi:aspartate/methionine/tyrosine aminotransferase
VPLLCQAHAKFTVDALSKIQGLRVVVPQGAMYVMVRVAATVVSMRCVCFQLSAVMV